MVHKFSINSLSSAHKDIVEEAKAQSKTVEVNKLASHSQIRFLAPYHQKNVGFISFLAKKSRRQLPSIKDFSKQFVGPVKA